MPVPLVYEIGAEIGPQLKRAVRSVESELKASNSRIVSDTRRTAVGGRSGGVDREARARASAEVALQRQRSAALTRVYNDEQRLERKAHDERLRNIAAEERAATRAATKTATMRQRAVQSFGKGVATSVGGSAKKVVGLGANALALGTGLIGGMAAGNAIQSRISVQAAAADLANQAYGNPGETRSREQIAADVRKQAADIDHRTGAGEENVVSGLRGFAAVSGELGKGQKLMPFITNLADATGANTGDLGTAGGRVLQAVQNSGVTDENEQLKQTKAILGQIAMQTKIGSIEMKDYAEHLSEITGAAGKFKGGAVPLIGFMSGIAQLSSAAGADGAEAATSAARLPSDLAKHSDKLRSMGVDVFTDKTGRFMKDPAVIMMDILKKTGGDQRKVGGIFDERARRVYDPLAQIYNTAETTKKGTGIAAVQAKLKPFLDARMGEKEANEAGAFRQGQDDRQIAKVAGDFNRAVGDELLPVLAKAIPKFAELVPVLGDVAHGAADLASWFAANPFTGLGAVVAGVVAKDLAAAGIQSAASAAAGNLFASIAARLGGGALPTSGPLAVAGAAIPAAASLVGVGYEAYGLTKDIMHSGTGNSQDGRPPAGAVAGIWDLLWNGPAKATGREDYDKLYPSAAASPPGRTAAAPEPVDAKELKVASAAMSGAAKELMGAAAALKGSSFGQPNVRRTNPMLDR